VGTGSPANREGGGTSDETLEYVDSRSIMVDVLLLRLLQKVCPVWSVLLGVCGTRRYLRHGLPLLDRDLPRGAPPLPSKMSRPMFAPPDPSYPASSQRFRTAG
jgi:hypothetical protein